MKTIVPGNVASACSSTSRDARSRWLVGSSMHRSAAGRTSIFASATRAFSPPESTAIFLTTASPEKRNAPRIVLSRVCPSSGAARASPARLAPDLHALDALEHLDAALHLSGLGRLVAEALDEPLDLRDALGLVPRLRLEELPARRALDEVVVVVARIDGDPRRAELGDRGHHTVQEVPVVRDEHDRAGVVGEEALEPVERREG